MHWSAAPEHRAAFTAHQRERRWQRIRAEMERQRLDVLVVLPQWLVDDALYVASQSGAVIFPREGEPMLLIGGEGSNLAIASDRGPPQRHAPRLDPRGVRRGLCHLLDGHAHPRGGSAGRGRGRDCRPG
jgi:hypothetical protein